MKVRFWGVRGFFAVASAEVLRYGGNTAAIEVRSDSGARLLIDFGTGAIPMGRALMAESFGRGQGHLSVLLTHTHLDHTAAMPFFVPVFVPGNRIDIYGSAAPASLPAVLEALFDPHVCPINSLSNLGATLRIIEVDRRTIDVDGFSIQPLCVPHGHSVGVAWRIQADGKTLVVMTGIDHPIGEVLPSAVEFCRGADLLLHDATWCELEQMTSHWGGSNVSQALRVADLAQVGRLGLTHHGPNSTDEYLDRVLARAQKATTIPVFAATEGDACEV